MDEANLPSLGFTWDEVITLLKTTGLDFAISLATAIAIFFVGSQVFGDYGSGGFSGFFSTVSGKIRSGDWVAWFLVLSPYLGWQTIRLTALAWRLLGRPQDSRKAPRNVERTEPRL